MSLGAEILTTYGRARLAMRRRPLEAIVADLRDARPGRFTPPADAHQLAGAVLGVLALMPTDSRCLVHALVLLELLERRGISATLLIGVRTEPTFLAHAWIVRDGEALLPDGDGEFAPLTSL